MAGPIAAGAGEPAASIFRSLPRKLPGFPRNLPVRDGEITLDGGMGTGSAGHGDGLETIELVAEFLAQFPFEEFRQGHGFAEGKVHGGTFTTSAGWPVAGGPAGRRLPRPRPAVISKQVQPAGARGTRRLPLRLRLRMRRESKPCFPPAPVIRGARRPARFRGVSAAAGILKRLGLLPAGFLGEPRVLQGVADPRSAPPNQGVRPGRSCCSLGCLEVAERNWQERYSIFNILYYAA